MPGQGMALLQKGLQVCLFDPDLARMNRSKRLAEHGDFQAGRNNPIDPMTKEQAGQLGV